MQTSPALKSPNPQIAECPCPPGAFSPNNTDVGVISMSTRVFHPLLSYQRRATVITCIYHQLQNVLEPPVVLVCSNWWILSYRKEGGGLVISHSGWAPVYLFKLGFYYNIFYRSNLNFEVCLFWSE